MVRRRRDWVRSATGAAVVRRSTSVAASTFGAEAFGLKVRCSEDGRNSLLLRYAHGILNVAGTNVPVPLDVGAERLELHVFLD
jgi:hypothetical protein